jgi:hypothetical protein
LVISPENCGRALKHIHLSQGKADSIPFKGIIMELKFLKDTTSTMGQPAGGHNPWPVLKIVGIYAVCGILWIYLSDTIIGGLTRDALH